MRQAAGSVPAARMMGATRPLVTYGLIAVNLVIFVLTAAQAHSASDVGPGTSRVFFDGVLFGPLVEQGEYWRLFTSGFLHFSVIHVGLNMLTLYILGRDLEMAIGSKRFLGIYVTALFGGSAAVSVFSPDAATAGASGAIYGVMGGLLVAVLRAKLPAGQIVALIAINIVISLSIPNISLWAHLGGLAFGAAATTGVLMAPRWVLPEGRRTAAAASRVGWIAIVALTLVAIAISAVAVATV
ncbi:rhomboid family intramembrane serine protease [Williamsia sp. MIQD14]|uniref:rhomboid family intramembrane serine protease n=1 Tax=Williamsia sp. MIQD14 TaxID=3425703 RepID=UPI003D9FE670